MAKLAKRDKLKIYFFGLPVRLRLAQLTYYQSLININMKLYNVKRESVFILASKFPKTFEYWHHLGTLFASAWISDEEAAKINLEFPNIIFINN